MTFSDGWLAPVGLALLAGLGAAGGTFALWHDHDVAPAQLVTSGQLRITEAGDPVWWQTSPDVGPAPHRIDPHSFMFRPGDAVAVDFPVQVTMGGDNLQAALTVDWAADSLQPVAGVVATSFEVLDDDDGGGRIAPAAPGAGQAFGQYAAAFTAQESNEYTVRVHLDFGQLDDRWSATGDDILTQLGDVEVQVHQLRPDVDGSGTVSLWSTGVQLPVQTQAGFSSFAAGPPGELVAADTSSQQVAVPVGADAVARLFADRQVAIPFQTSAVSQGNMGLRYWLTEPAWGNNIFGAASTQLFAVDSPVQCTVENAPDVDRQPAATPVPATYSATDVPVVDTWCLVAVVEAFPDEGTYAGSVTATAQDPAGVQVQATDEWYAQVTTALDPAVEPAHVITVEYQTFRPDNTPGTQRHTSTVAP